MTGAADISGAASSQPAAIPRYHAANLSYDSFVRLWMAPNLPVIIQVTCWLFSSMFCFDKHFSRSQQCTKQGELHRHSRCRV